MIRFLAGGVLLLAAASLVSFSALLFRGRTAVESRGFGATLASLAVDYCPILLLAACGRLFVAYRPIALTYEQFMRWPAPVYDFRGLTRALYAPYGMPDGLMRLSSDYLNAYHYWMAAIVGLSVVAIYILFRRRPYRPAL
jgi:hypothetical protein